MTESIGNRSRRRKALFDLLLLLTLSLVAEWAHFSWKHGRHIICADSVQYVDGAQTLLNGATTAHFGFRKPGYSVLLAATSLLFGNMSWGAVIVNHLFQSLIPLAAYGLGRCLLDRRAGWLAAVLVMAQLQTEVRADRIMSETVYATLLAFAAWVFVAGLPRKPIGLWMMGAGALFGLAWLTRSIAVCAVCAAAVGLFWNLRRTPLRSVGAGLCFLFPIVGCVLLECGLNRRFSGQFRPSTGTLGPAMLIRMRSFVGAEFPQSEAAAQCLTLLPERSREDAYLVNKLDGWVAWHRAIHERGMSEWEVDALMKRAAWEMMAANPRAHWTSFGEVFVRYLLRQSAPPSLGRVPPERQQPVVLPPDVVRTPLSEEYWYAHYALPKRTSRESLDLVERMREGADEKAPIGSGSTTAALRYYSQTPTVTDLLGLIRQLARLWPGFALLACVPLGLNRRFCALVALAYGLDALAVAATAFSDADLERFQFVWMPIDVTLAAGLLIGLTNRVFKRRSNPELP